MAGTTAARRRRERASCRGSRSRPTRFSSWTSRWVGFDVSGGTDVSKVTTRVTETLASPGELLRLDAKAGELIAREYSVEVAGTEVRLELKAPMVVGNHGSADLRLADAAVSRRHLQFEPRP